MFSAYAVVTQYIYTSKAVVIVFSIRNVNFIQSVIYTQFMHLLEPFWGENDCGLFT